MSIGVDGERAVPDGPRRAGSRSRRTRRAAGRARNRRVEIIIQSQVVNQTLDNAGLDKTPTTTPKPVQPERRTPA